MIQSTYLTESLRPLDGLVMFPSPTLVTVIELVRLLDSLVLYFLGNGLALGSLS